MLDGSRRPTGEQVGALPEWLWRITPPGAPLIPILDVPHKPGPGCVPCIIATIAAIDDQRRPPDWPRTARDAGLIALVPDGVRRLPREQSARPRDAIDRWAMEAAYFRDLCGEDEQRIAQRLNLGTDSDRHSAPRSRSARRYVSRGRQLLADLGAWPWCMVTAGRLGSRWWTDRLYVDALAAWHFDATVGALDEVMRPVRYAAGERPAWRVAY